MRIKTIAETAWHHNGDIEFMLNLVTEILNKSNSDFIKLHLMLDRSEYMSLDHPAYKAGQARQFTENQWELIINLVKKSEKKLMLLLNDCKAIDFGLRFDPELIEIHSVCLNDYHLLSCIKQKNDKNIPLVLGVGGTTLYEIENAINFLETDNVILMHGFQNYPTQYMDINFNRIRKIMNLYPNLGHGYADHTAWDEPNNNLITTMGAALGMEYIEKHVTTVYGEDRLDWQAAIGIEQFNDLAKDLNLLNQCNGNGFLKLNDGEEKYSIFGPNKKAGVLTKDIKKGHILTMNDIAFKRTGGLSDTSQTEVWSLVGKEAIGSYQKDTIITKDKYK